MNTEPANIAFWSKVSKHNPENKAITVYFCNDGETPGEKELERLRKWIQNRTDYAGGPIMVTPESICELT